MFAKPQAFTLHVPDAQIEDLKARLVRTRLPDQAPNSRWEYGADLTYMRSLIEYWRTSFDWRAQEAKLNAFPQFKVPLANIDVHYLNVPGNGPDPKPLLLMHGWPGSVFEFIDMIPRLTDPTRFGGKAEDAFTVIAPSLPGYGLSFRPNQERFTIPEIADCFAELMTSVLGFKRFGAQGGDWGAFTCSGARSASPDKAHWYSPQHAVHQPLHLDAERNQHGRGATLLRGHQALVQGRDRLHPDTRHAAADACLCVDELTGGARGVDCREISHLDGP